MLDRLSNSMIHLALNRPKAVIWAMITSTLLIIGLAVAPSLWPERFPLFPEAAR